MEMNSKVVPFPGHCFADLFLYGITKQPVHSPGLLKSALITAPVEDTFAARLGVCNPAKRLF